MRVLVCGDRDWFAVATLRRALDGLLEKVPVDVVIEGEALGADSAARDWALARGIRVLPFPAEWERYGRAAGPIRNQRMLDEGRPDIVVWFHPDLAASRGTRDIVTRAQRARVPVWDGLTFLEKVRDGERGDRT